MYDQPLTTVSTTVSPSAIVFVTVASLLTVMAICYVIFRYCTKLEQRARWQRANRAAKWTQDKVEEELQGIVEATVRAL